MPEPWTLLDRRTVLADRFLALHQDRVRMPSGRVLDPFWQVESPAWVCAVPVLPDGALVAVEQYRHGAGRVCRELPAGNCDPGEDPAAAVLRELAEETGYPAVAEPEPLASLWPEPSRASTRAHGFLVRVAPVPGDLHRDADEDLAVRVLAPAEWGAPAWGGLVHGAQLAFLLLARARLDG